jgi:plastocyanin
MSHDEHGHEKEPIILTSGRRFGKGLAIVVITLAIGAAIAVPFFHDFYKNPPPVTQIRKPAPAPSEQPPAAAAAGTTTISILQGASTQGSPDFSSDEKPNVPLGNKIVWENQDTIPHTATSGTNGKPDGKFDTSIISGGEKSKPVELKDAKQGDTINYFCSIHPYMTSKITITGKQQGGAAAGGTSGGSVAAGATLTILEGASVQGSPDFDPDSLKAKAGDTIHVTNKDTIPHTVTSGTNGKPDGKFDTSIISPGESADIKLDKVKAGEVDYFCSIHPYMTGKITVG